MKRYRNFCSYDVISNNSKEKKRLVIREYYVDRESSRIFSLCKFRIVENIAIIYLALEKKANLSLTYCIYILSSKSISTKENLDVILNIHQ